jgi:hypothetical protein
VEAGLKDISVSPSQGSHFFQNITSFMVGYFTINSKIKEGYINWDWIMKQKPCELKNYTRHLQFQDPIIVKMNGHQNQGIILKPQGGE